MRTRLGPGPKRRRTVGIGGSGGRAESGASRGDSQRRPGDGRGERRRRTPSPGIRRFVVPTGTWRLGRGPGRPPGDPASTLRLPRETAGSRIVALTPGAVTVTLSTSIKVSLTVLRENPQKLRGGRRQVLENAAAEARPRSCGARGRPDGWGDGIAFHGESGAVVRRPERHRRASLSRDPPWGSNNRRAGDRGGLRKPGLRYARSGVWGPVPWPSPPER